MGSVLPKGPEVCAKCGVTKSPSGKRLVKHHIDGNHDNDVIENVQWLCHPCHARHHKTGIKPSSETRAKTSETMKGRLLTLEHRVNLSSVMKGRMPSETTRLKSIAAIKGKPLRIEHREAIRSALIGREFTPEWRAKISATKKGKIRPPFSAEWRANIGEAQKGMKRSPETRMKISVAAKKREYSRRLQREMRKEEEEFHE